MKTRTTSPGDSIIDHPRVNKAVSEFYECIKQWKSNPAHWSNNKRRMHGYCTLRGCANNKKRFLPPEDELISHVERLLNEVSSVAIGMTIDGMTSIKDLAIGDKPFDEMTADETIDALGILKKNITEVLLCRDTWKIDTQESGLINAP